MPKYHFKIATCKYCELETEHQLWDYVDGLENPLQKSEILAGSFFDFTCSHCKKNFQLEHSCLYSDNKFGFLIYFSPIFDEEKLGKILFENGITNYDGLILRLATDFIDFREKIKILEDGLNDRAIELVKTMIVSNLLENAQLELSRILYHSNDEQEKNIAFVLLLKDEKIKLIKIPYAFYQHFAKMVSDLMLVDSVDIFETIDVNWALNLVTTEGIKNLDKDNKEAVKYAE